MGRERTEIIVFQSPLAVVCAELCLPELFVCLLCAAEESSGVGRHAKKPVQDW